MWHPAQKRHSVAPEDADAACELLKKTSGLFESIRKPSELRLDAKVSKEVFSIASGRMKKMCRETKISLEEFLKVLGEASGKDLGDGGD